MSLLLAPYNDAMRLGMGFNSFTQQLCVNDAVMLPGGIKASDKNLINSSPADEKGRPAPGVPTYSPSTETTPYGHPKTTGGTFVRKHQDGSQAEVSQIVTWRSTFVNNISEITENMNINGSLAIKVDAVGGGAKAEAHYINMESFKKSDINYHLQVDVVNQKLVGDNVTEFMPIKNVQPNQFQEVYGDSFISGFLEGGVFNAIISIELANKSEVKDFGGEFSIQAKFAEGAVGADVKAAGVKETSNKSTNDKITVSVSWSGGGDIITDEVQTSGWNMVTLKQVAMSFADKVALCPQKTNAILTKYSSLRSFYEKNLHGSPLDYENAGVYSSALLDAYMDYKAAWKELQVMTYEVSKGTTILTKATDQPEIKDIAEEAEAHYQEQLVLYNAAQTAKQPDEESSLVKYTPASNDKVGKPLPPNKLNTYAPTVFGLDQAQRDCRFEMIKIVREVDAVSVDPQVAVDPTRNNQFLSSAIFRQLMPGGRKVDPVQMEQDIKSLTAEKAALTTRIKSLESDLKQPTADEIKNIQEINSKLQSELEAERNRVTELTLQQEFLQSKLSPSWHIRNDLDMGFHGRAVSLVNMGSMKQGNMGFAFDMGREGGTRVHAISFRLGNDNQKIILEKVDPNDPTSSWYLKCNDRYLYRAGNATTLYCDPGLSLQDGCYEWWIEKCKNDRGYLIRNAQDGYIHVDEMQENGLISCQTYSDDARGNLGWAIICI